MIIITHKLSEVLAISDEVTVMRDGRVVGQVQKIRTPVIGAHDGRSGSSAVASRSLIPRLDQHNSKHEISQSAIG